MKEFNDRKFSELSSMNRLKKIAYHLRDKILGRNHLENNHYKEMIHYVNTHEYLNLSIPETPDEIKNLYEILSQRILEKDPYQEKVLFDSIGIQRTFFPITLVLENIRSPFNVGSLFRTAESLGVEDILLVGITPTPETNQKIAKTAKDAIIPYQHIQKLTPHTLPKKSRIWGIEKTNHSESIYSLKKSDFNRTQHYTLILGNEEFGIPKETLDLCEQVYHIPLLGMKNSLNVSVAGGIFLQNMASLFNKD